MGISWLELAIGTMDEKLPGLRERLGRIRSQGYSYFDNLERELEQLDARWREIRPKVIGSSQATARPLLEPLSEKRQDLEAKIWSIEFTLDTLSRSSFALRAGEKVILAVRTILYWAKKHVDVLLYLSKQRLVLEQVVATESKDSLGTLMKLALRGVHKDVTDYYLDVDIAKIAQVKREEGSVTISLSPTDDVPFDWELVFAEIEVDTWLPVLEAARAGSI